MAQTQLAGGTLNHLLRHDPSNDTVKRRTLVSWSSGKDSAWTLHILQQQPDIEVAGLFCTVNQKHLRVAMHAVRQNLLQRQADHIGLPLHIIPLPDPCSHAEYASAMEDFIHQARRLDIKCMAFGDLYLEDVRAYRERNLVGTGIAPLFPLWGMDTGVLSREMIAGGLSAYITCVDPRCLPRDCAGRAYDESFVHGLPEEVDPCGENGEFHSFVHDGPMFRQTLAVEVGEIVDRDGFVFADLLPAHQQAC